jgi:hypothetical protein
MLVLAFERTFWISAKTKKLELTSAFCAFFFALLSWFLLLFGAMMRMMKSHATGEAAGRK